MDGETIEVDQIQGAEKIKACRLQNAYSQQNAVLNILVSKIRSMYLIFCSLILLKVSAQSGFGFATLDTTSGELSMTKHEREG